MSGNKLVAFIGATGMLGKPTAEALLAAGFNVRAVCRDPNKACKVLPIEMDIVAGDVRDITQLAKAFAGVDVIYLNLATQPDEKHAAFHPETDGLRNVIAAAKQAGVTRIAYLSSLMARAGGYRWWALDIKREALDILKVSGLNFTIYYPSNFMENVPYRNKQGTRVNLAGKFPYKNYWLAASDYGKQVAKSLRSWQSGNREYVMQGTEALTYEEAAQLFVDNYTESKLTVAKAPLALLRFIGLFSPLLNYVANISGAIQAQPEPFASKATWEELGKPEITMAKFASICHHRVT
jgi:uncharacterized protein YbjT (DUF2867 family)